MKPKVFSHVDRFRKLGLDRQMLHMETKHRFFIEVNPELVMRMHQVDHEGSGRAAHHPPDEGSGV